MITDANDNIVHMSTEEAETYEEAKPVLIGSIVQIDTTELDDELGLAVVAKQTIMEKYGVHCDPSKNSFHRSLHDQYEMRGTLSVKQVNALRSSR